MSPLMGTAMFSVAPVFFKSNIVRHPHCHFHLDEAGFAGHLVHEISGTRSQPSWNDAGSRPVCPGPSRTQVPGCSGFWCNLGRLKERPDDHNGSREACRHAACDGQGLQRHRPSTRHPDVGTTDLRLNVPLPASGEGPQAKPRVPWPRRSLPPDGS